MSSTTPRPPPPSIASPSPEGPVAGTVPPSATDLRRFGLQSAASIMIVLGFVLPWLRQAAELPRVPFGVGLALGLAAVLWPRGLTPLYLLAHGAAARLAQANTVVLLTAFYVLVITPVGLAMRALGKDPLRRKFEPDAPTYRLPSRRTKPHHYEVPF